MKCFIRQIFSQLINSVLDAIVNDYIPVQLIKVCSSNHCIFFIKIPDVCIIE